MAVLEPTPDQRAVAEQAFQYAATADRSPGGASALIRKTDLLVDRSIEANQRRTGLNPACREGCNHCCHSVVMATLAEVTRVFDEIDQRFSPDQRAALLEKLQAYERTVAPTFGLNLHLVRTPCPLLVDGLCSVYASRPLKCRAANSTDPEACKKLKERPDSTIRVPTAPGQAEVAMAATQGLCQGQVRAGADGGLYDFARALKIALSDPGSVDQLWEGDNRFGPAAPQEPQPERPLFNVPWKPTRYRPGEEPTGRIEPTDLAEAEYQSRKVGDLEAAFKALRDDHPVYKMWRIRVPYSHSSEDEIPVWRTRFATALREFARSGFDPREAFDALSFAPTFDLAYQGQNDLQLLSEFGNVLVDRITAKALPDLCEPIDLRRTGGKLKVGYISCNLRNSNGGNWALGWLKNHAEDIETYAFNLNSAEDSVSAEFRRHADHYFHLRGPVPADARFIKSLRLDALIFPDIGMDGANYQYATMRLAPVQCAAWGHPVTSGLSTIDHYLSSDLMEPEDADQHYRENLVRLPRSGLCYAPIRYAASDLVKSDFGLDDGPLTLSCQNPMKYHPHWDFLYREISERTGRPIVFLDWRTPCGQDVVWRRMEKAGVRAIRIPSLRPADFLGLLKLADVSLDPPAWSGGNTTIEALRLGVPVVTLPGQFMRGRHSLAFLQIANVSGLIAEDAEDYIDLASNPDRRAAAMQNLNAEALFDDVEPVHALDAFLRSASLGAVAYSP